MSLTTKGQIREALKRLEDVEILVDHRVDCQGAEEWNFTLKLWSKDTAQNLEYFKKTLGSKASTETKKVLSSTIASSVISSKRKSEPFYAPPLPRCYVSRPEHLKAVSDL